MSEIFVYFFAVDRHTYRSFVECHGSFNTYVIEISHRNIMDAIVYKRCVTVWNYWFYFHRRNIKLLYNRNRGDSNVLDRALEA